MEAGRPSHASRALTSATARYRLPLARPLESAKPRPAAFGSASVRNVCHQPKTRGVDLRGVPLDGGRGRGAGAQSLYVAGASRGHARRESSGGTHQEPNGRRKNTANIPEFTSKDNTPPEQLKDLL